VTTFSSTMATPPGGRWFWEDGKVSFVSTSYLEVIDKMREYFQSQGINKDPRTELIDFMCPRMPRSFCRGYRGPSRMTSEQYLQNSFAYKDYQLETADIVQQRMKTCRYCTEYDQGVCSSCFGYTDHVYEMFQGRRARLPEDTNSGACKCAKALAMAVASVVYKEDEPIWDGTPKTCWRYKQ
jgi:hypothetical protein